MKQSKASPSPPAGERGRKSAGGGIKAGMKEGIREGLKEGLAEGQKKTAHEMVIRLLNLGVDDETIRKAAGLSPEGLAALESETST